MKYIIDTDIGDDIDDALAIVEAIKLQYDVIGITTVFHNTISRARMAKFLINSYNKNYPVYAGSCNGVKIKNSSEDYLCQYSSEMDKEIYTPDGGEKEAIDFLVDSACKYKEQLTIIALGPLTNIALAIKKNLSSMKNIQLCIMGGAYFMQLREWNIVCDPEAAEIVFEAGLKMKCYGFDITRYTQFNTIQFENFKKILVDNKENVLKGLIEKWCVKNTFLPYLHDALALYAAHYPAIAEMLSCEIKIETQGKYSKGMTLNIDEFYCYNPRREIENRVEVAYKLNKNFVDQFIEIWKKDK